MCSIFLYTASKVDTTRCGVCVCGGGGGVCVDILAAEVIAQQSGCQRTVRAHWWYRCCETQHGVQYQLHN